jgi:hypothetical protein
MSDSNQSSAQNDSITNASNSYDKKNQVEDDFGLKNAADAPDLLINTRVKRIRPLVPPQIIQEDIPLYVIHLISYLLLSNID